MKTRVQFYSNQRVGLPDMKDSAGGLLAFAEAARKTRASYLPSGRNTGAANTDARILEGFDYSVPGGLGVGDTLVITRGKGIFPAFEQGEIVFGEVFAENDPASITLDASALGAGTYDVYIRFVLTQTDNENRVFWNRTSAAEEVQNVATREVGSWEGQIVASGAGAPGYGDYIKIYEITVGAGPVISAVADYRHFYFEGDAEGASFTQEWGDGANDRSASRATYPIGDWHMFGQMVRRQLRDIIDPAAVTNHVKAPDTNLKACSDTISEVTTARTSTVLGSKASLDARLESMESFWPIVVVSPTANEGHYTGATGLQSAITALNALNGGTIFVKAGTYTITSAVSLTKPMRIIGVDGEVILSFTTGASLYFDFDTGTSYEKAFYVEGIKCVPATPGTDNYYQITVRAPAKFTGCYFEDCYIYSDPTNVLWSVLFELCFITREYNFNQYSAQFTNTTTVDSCIFINSVTDNVNTKDFIRFEAQRGSFRDCYISMSEDWDLYLYNTINCEINVSAFSSTTSTRSIDIVGTKHYKLKITKTESRAFIDIQASVENLVVDLGSVRVAGALKIRRVGNSVVEVKDAYIQGDFVDSTLTATEAFIEVISSTLRKGLVRVGHGTVTTGASGIVIRPSTIDHVTIDGITVRAKTGNFSSSTPGQRAVIMPTGDIERVSILNCLYTHEDITSDYNIGPFFESGNIDIEKLEIDGCRFKQSPTTPLSAQTLVVVGVPNSGRVYVALTNNTFDMPLGTYIAEIFGGSGNTIDQLIISGNQFLRTPASYNDIAVDYVDYVVLANNIAPANSMSFENIDRIACVGNAIGGSPTFTTIGTRVPATWGDVNI